MEIGNLKQRIKIYKNITVTDSIGNHKTCTEEISSCWAKVYVRSSNESRETGVTKEIQKTEFVIRQNIQLSISENCIEFRDCIYNITGIIPDYLNMNYMKLICEVRK